MAAKFELYSSAGKTRFRLKSGNGQTVLTSQGYKTKRAAQNGIASIKKNSKKDSFYDRRKSKKGQPYFVLKAANEITHHRWQSSRPHGLWKSPISFTACEVG